MKVPMCKVKLEYFDMTISELSEWKCSIVSIFLENNR